MGVATSGLHLALVFGTKLHVRETMLVARAKNKVLADACRLGFGDRKNLYWKPEHKMHLVGDNNRHCWVKFKLHIGVTKHK